MDNWEKLNISVGLTALSIVQNDLEDKLRKCGIMYRIFSRCKSLKSLKKKLEVKKDTYTPDGKKLQDMLGIRIVFYFSSDVRPFCEILKKDSLYSDISDSENEFRENLSKICPDCKKGFEVKFEELFGPTRLNLVLKMDGKTKAAFRSELEQLPTEVARLIDDTYEVQLRSVLSEGWHEVEHDLRYKCKSEWKGFEMESRMLNGIYGSLEAHEWAMEMMFENKAHSHYLRHEWEPMLRNHLRLRLAGNLSADISRILDSSQETAKQLLRFNREEILYALSEMKSSYSINFDNLVFLINRMLILPDKQIVNQEPEIIKRKLDTNKV